MANDRDCENCKHKVNGACNVWECKFEPKRGMTKDEAIEIIECGESSISECQYQAEGSEE